MNQIDKVNEYLNYFEELKGEIPGIEKLINKLRKERNKEGHLVHAWLVKKIHESRKFTITAVEKNFNGYDIDIELDNAICIQVWHGASTGFYELMGNLKQAEEKIVKINNREVKVRSWGGGVRVDWEKDKNKILDKFNQLPPQNIGFVLCYNRGSGICVLPEWLKDFPDNKALIEVQLEKNGSDYSYRIFKWHNSKFPIDLLNKLIESIFRHKEG